MQTFAQKMMVEFDKAQNKYFQASQWLIDADDFKSTLANFTIMETQKKVMDIIKYRIEAHQKEKYSVRAECVKE